MRSAPRVWSAISLYRRVAGRRRGPPVGRLVLASGILLGSLPLAVALLGSLVLRAGEPEARGLEMVLWTRGPSLRTATGIRNSES